MPLYFNYLGIINSCREQNEYLINQDTLFHELSREFHILSTRIAVQINKSLKLRLDYLIESCILKHKLIDLADSMEHHTNN